MVNQDKPMDSSKSMSNPNLALETIHLTCSRVNRSLDPFCVHISMVILSLNVVNPDVHPSSHGSDKGCNTIRHHQLIMPWSWRGIWMWSLSAALTASSELSIIALLPSTKSSAWKSPPLLQVDQWNRESGGSWRLLCLFQFQTGRREGQGSLVVIIPW